MLLDIIKSAIKVVLSSLDYKNEYGTICITEKGEKVQSQAEKMIADYLYSSNFRYEYEKPAFTRGIWIFHDEVSHPDFYLLDFDVYIEYWGLVSAKDYRVRDEYTRVMKWKMTQYHENNIKFISLYPQNLDNLDWIFKTKLREVTGLDFQLEHYSDVANSRNSQSARQNNNGLDDKVVKQLGGYYDKLQVSNDEDGIKLHSKQWMKREECNDINEIVRANGFRWQPNGKDSCWTRMHS